MRRNNKRWREYTWEQRLVRHVLLHNWWLSNSCLSLSTPTTIEFVTQNQCKISIINLINRVHILYPTRQLQSPSIPILVLFWWFLTTHSSTLTLRNKQMLQQQTKKSFVFIYVYMFVNTLVDLFFIMIIKLMVVLWFL